VGGWQERGKAEAAKRNKGGTVFTSTERPKEGRRGGRRRLVLDWEFCGAWGRRRARMAVNTRFAYYWTRAGRLVCIALVGYLGKRDMSGPGEATGTTCRSGR